MFKKYAKNFLEKEVVENSPIENDLPTQNPYFDLSSEPAENSSLEEPETIISEGLSFKGELSFQRCLRIDGTFEGELISEGKLIVGPKGVVKANLHLQEAYIAGKVQGDISVKERLVLRGRAEIVGNISAPLLSVDEGVAIVGHVHVSATQPDNIAN